MHLHIETANIHTNFINCIFSETVSCYNLLLFHYKIFHTFYFIALSVCLEIKFLIWILYTARCTISECLIISSAVNYYVIIVINVAITEKFISLIKYL